MSGTVMIAAPSERSRAYARTLNTRGLVPERVLCLGGAMLEECAGWTVDALDAEHVRDDRVAAWLDRHRPGLVVYSGYGGQIVPASLLERAPFLHVHAGRLPSYRGSTTMHFMLLREDACAATAILLEPSIDTGRIVMTRAYPPPPPGVALDEWDVTIRADLLGRALAAGPEAIDAARPQNEQGPVETYYVIHPVLKRLAAERAAAHGDAELRVGIVVQARLSSSRLPGKVLRTIGGRPMLELLLERLERAVEADAIVVATSDEDTDDPIAIWCASRGVTCFRGSLEDVAGRLEDAAAAHALDALVRVCADSPFLDPALVREAIERFRRTRPDLVTNVHPGRSYPRGQSVEVIRRATLAAARASMTEPGDREHVTTHFYRCPERYRIESMTARAPDPETRHVVDTPEDLAVAERIVGAMTRPAWTYSWEDVSRLVEG